MVSQSSGAGTSFWLNLLEIAIAMGLESKVIRKRRFRGIAKQQSRVMPVHNTLLATVIRVVRGFREILNWHLIGFTKPLCRAMPLPNMRLDIAIARVMGCNAM